MEIDTPAQRAVLESELDSPPRTVLEAPAAVRDLIETHASGLRRVVVLQILNRTTQMKVGAVRIMGAESGKRHDGDTLELVLELVMRIVSSTLEQTGEGGGFRFQVHTIDAKGKTRRAQQRDVTLAGLYETGPTEAPSENAEMLRYLSVQNRHMLALCQECRLMAQESRQALRTVATYAETLSGRLVDALVAERNANTALAQAERDSISATSEHAIELEKIKQRQQFIEMFSPVMQQVSSEIGVNAAEQLGVGAKSKTKAAAKKNPLAAQKKKPSADSSASSSSSSTTEEPAAEPEAELEEETDPELERLQGLKAEHPELFSAGMLYRSLTDDQLEKILEAMGTDAFSAFELASQATTNEECLAELERMTELAPKDATPKILAALDGKQQGVIGTLRFAVMRRRGQV